MMSLATTMEYADWDVPEDGQIAPLRRQIRHTQALTTGEYVQDNRRGEFDAHIAKLAQVAITPELWPDRTEAPSEYAVDLAMIVIDQLRWDDVLPTRVVASAEGGVAICFVNDNKYADFECLNTGEILAVTSNRRDRPVAWKVAPSTSEIARASDRIRMFLDAPATGSNGPKWSWLR